jgi:hypothetical protein
MRLLSQWSARFLRMLREAGIVADSDEDDTPPTAYTSPAAICFRCWPGSRLRATFTTSSRNSSG